MMRRSRVFVAGASCELERVREVMAAVDAHPGLVNAYDWTIPVEAHGGDVGPNQLREELARDEAELRRSDALIVVVPLPGNHTEGAWVEMGIAMGIGIPVVMLGMPRPGYGWLHWGTLATDAAVSRVALEVGRGVTLKVSHDNCCTDCVFCYDAISCEVRDWQGLLGELAHLPDGTVRPPEEDGWSCPLLEGPVVVTSAGGSE